MTARDSIVYSVSTRSGGTWTPRGEAVDMRKAIGAAEGMLTDPACDRVRVDKTFFDVDNAREVTTTILEKGRPEAAKGRSGLLRWVLIAAGGGLVSFAVTYALATGALG